jgi:23S rRNA A2030 N6-methylase RlmJ
MSLISAENDTLVAQFNERAIYLVQFPFEMYFSFTRGESTTAEVRVRNAEEAHAVWEALYNEGEEKTFNLKRSTFIIRHIGGDVELEFRPGHSVEERRIFRFPRAAVRDPNA